MSRSIFLYALLVLLYAFCTTMPAAAHQPPGRPQLKTCVQLAGSLLAVRNVLTASSQITPASATTPAFCQVTLTRYHAVNIRVGLPLNSLDGGAGGAGDGAWNGKVQALGGGGYNGTVGAVTGPVTDGYAASATDSGHSVAWCNAINPKTGLPNAQPNCGAGGGGFVLDPFNRLIEHQINDFVKDAYIAQTRTALSLVKLYYGREAKRNYWVGCSEGGGEGLTMAQEAPELFDGYLVGAPAVNLNRFIIGSTWSNIVVKDLIGPTGLSQAKVNATATAAVAACDTDDGIADGVVTEPRRCSFNATALICKGNASDSATCLTPQEAASINSIWDGARDSRGELIWGGPSKGTTYSVGLQPSPNRMPWLQYWMHQDPQFDWRQIDIASFPQEFELSYRKFAHKAARDSTDLNAVRARGAKILHYHGLADQLIPPFNSYNYLGRVYDRYGVKNTQQFMRSYFFPGVMHCGGGNAPQPDVNKLLKVLEAWVERDTAPNYVVGSQTLPSGAARTRKICKYPDEVVYNGSGSTDDEASFSCRVNRKVPADLAAAAVTINEREDDCDHWRNDGQDRDRGRDRGHDCGHAHADDGSRDNNRP